MARQVDEGQATAFARVLADEINSGSQYRDVTVLNLEDAAGMLWVSHAVWNGGAALKRAMREVDQKTKGQPFRLDTPAGPVFLDVPLWRFGGRSGIVIADEEKRPHKKRPTWDGDWRASEAA